MGLRLRLSKEGLASSLIACVRRSSLKADIFFGGNYTQFESHKHLFESYLSPEVATVLPDYQLPSDRATPYTINGSVLIVNNELAQGLSITSYEDLLQPALKGKIAFADPNKSSSAFSQLTNILLAKGGYTHSEAWDYVKQLLINTNSRRAASSSDVYQSVAEGKMIVGLTYEDPCINLQRVAPTFRLSILEKGQCLSLHLWPLSEMLQRWKKPSCSLILCFLEMCNMRLVSQPVTDPFVKTLRQVMT